jgi:phosphoadenosine phosphosulfate reductase
MSIATVQVLLDTTKDFSIEETLDFLAKEYPNQVVFSTSFGQEDQVITNLIGQNQLPITVFTLDTGRLFQETYDVFHKQKSRLFFLIQLQ